LCPLGRGSIAAVVTALALLGVVLLLLSAALLSTRDGEVLADAPQDLPDLELPDRPLQPQDVEHVRFSLAPRGYRMSEVDAVLDRLAAELADRDRRLAALQGGRTDSRSGGAGPGSSSTLGA
jgi:DivIVA domain-containing protein